MSQNSSDAKFHGYRLLVVLVAMAALMAVLALNWQTLLAWVDVPRGGEGSAAISPTLHAKATSSQVNDPRVDLLRHTPLQNMQQQPVTVEALMQSPSQPNAMYRRTIINFWGSWCPPCLEELPDLVELYQRDIQVPVNQAQQYQMIGIAIDSPSNVREFLTQQPLPYPLLLGGLSGTEIMTKLGNTAGVLPMTVVLDERGALLFKRMGKVTAAELRQILQSPM
jgi:thiol-disulfide isomerase/thioredoxin